MKDYSRPIVGTIASNTYTSKLSENSSSNKPRSRGAVSNSSNKNVNKATTANANGMAWKGVDLLNSLNSTL